MKPLLVRKATELRRGGIWRLNVVAASLVTVFLQSPVEAAVLGNADFVGGTPSLTLPTGWAIGGLPIGGLFDGDTGNPGNGRVSFTQIEGSPLSDTNFISIIIDLNQPFEINSFRIANDHGTNPDNEVTSLTTILSGSSGPLSTIVTNGIDVTSSMTSTMCLRALA
jgi:hypothetical protein